MKRNDKSCCSRQCHFGCCCRASRRAHHAPYWSGDEARAPQSPRQPPGRERRRPELAGSWAAAAEEEEAAAVAAPWVRDYFAEDHGEMVPRTSHAAAFLSDTKDRGPPIQSQTWRSGEKAPFGQTYSLRAFEKPPQVQTQALRDFEKHLNDLKKENFSLKLRIYFLEERMQQKYEASREDIYKRVSAGLDALGADVENPNSHNEAELRRQFEERQQETEHVYELLENKIQLLQEESRLARNEAARMAALVEAEKECNLELSEKLKGVTKDREDAPGNQVKPDQYTEALAQRDKRIEELSQSLAAQERLVEQLSREKQLLYLSEEPNSMEVQDLSATLLCKLEPGQREIAEELCQRLQQKERMLQDLLSDRNKQAVEHEMEIKGLLQSVRTREQESQVRTNAETRKVSELRKALQQLQEELQSKSQQLRTLEAEKCNEIRTQEQNIQHLNHSLSHKEQLLQELRELLQYQGNSDKTLEANEMLLEKLRQRIQDRAVALERAIDEKFSALEEKEKEVRQVHLAVRERDHDLERLRGVLSSNEATMQVRANSVIDLVFLSHLYSKPEPDLSANILRSLMERNSELQALRQYLGGKDFMISQVLISNQQTEVTSIGPALGEQTDQSSMQIPSRDNSTSLTAKEDASIPRSTLGDLDTVAGLEKELSNAKEELELMTKKERESQMELSALQSMVAVQEEELQVQAADMESLTRNIQIKEDLIKDLQMQLVDPEDIPAMERLTQEVLLLREKVASVESQGQEISGNRRQQLLLMLEGLVDERSRLNEALQAERQLYSSLVKFHAHPESSERDRTLQVELEGAQVLRSRLEEVLGRSLERLSRLETLAAIGGAAAGDDTEDASTEFTDSIEEEAAHNSHQQLIKVALEKSLATAETQNMSLAPPSSMGGDGNRCLQEEMLHLRAEIHQHLEEKRKAEAELKELKAQIEEAGFSSVSHIRNTMLSLCLENAELKEQMGEAMSDGGEIEEDKEKGEVMVETVVAKGGLNENSLQAEFRKLQGKLKNAHNIINLLKEQLVLSSKEGNGKPAPELLVHLAREIDRMNTELVCPPGKHQQQEEEDVTTRPCPRPQSLDLGPPLAVDALQLDNQSQACNPEPQLEFSLPGSTKHLRSQLAQCRQRYQDLQEKLLLSEATVFAQASQLEKYRAIFSESLVKQDSKQVQVDLQDLGYETCGRSENEAEREETTSPECEEHNSLKEMVLMEGLCSEQGRQGSALASSPGKKPLESQRGKQEEFQAYGKSEDISVLQKDIKDLKSQLQNANKVIQNLKSRIRSLSVTSDYSSSLERPRKLRAVGTLEGSSPRSVTDEDEEWLSDGTGAFYPPGLQAKKDLESLIQRVSQLEAQLPKTGLEGKLAEELRSASWPGKYDSLIQDQARELSYLRQKIREGRGICYLLTQHAKDTVKSFEDLLRSNDIDYYLGQSFREQLAQGSQLTERLTSKLSTKDHKSEKDQAGLEPLALRLSRELQEKEKVIEVLQAKLDAQSLTPPSSRALSDSHRSPSSTSFLSDELEACSDMDIASEYTQYEEKKASSGLSGFHFHSIPKLASFPQAPLPSAPSSFLPFSPPGPPLLGCGETPVVSLAEAQQELQMLQKQLGESVSTVPPAPPATLPNNHLETSSSHYLNPAQPHSPLSGGLELGRILEPGYLGSSGQWGVMRPQKGSVSGDLSSGSSVCQLNSKPTGADLLEEHLGEIRNLRQRLEESICINDRLREQLEHRLSSTARGRTGSTSNFYGQGLESIPQLCNENRVLREENRSLQAQLSHISRERSQETESLKEALLSSRSRLQELEKELEHQKVERQQILEDLREKQQEILHFREERLSLQENDSRLQHKLALLQQQCEEKQQLFQSLQSELQIYETLYGNSKKGLKAYSLDACHQVPLSSDLSHLVAEIRALRGQLEQSIQVNNCLRLQLQQQLEGGAGKVSHGPSSINQNFPATADPGNKQPILQDSAASPPVRDVGMNSPVLVFPGSSLSAPGSDTATFNRTDGLGLDTSPVMKNPPKLEGDATDGSFANKHGRHVIGHVDDYSALRQQIGEGKLLVKKIASLVRAACDFPGLEAPGTEVLGSKSIHELRSSASALHHALEESASLLTMFWRAALPSTHSPVLPGKVRESTERELLELRTKISKQERLLQSTAERLKTTNQQKESMEQFIVSQLTRTHDVLKKARTNLEVKSLRALPCTPAL
uniref:Phosphodiesterase 4D interacting protein n=1 Tax=Propithecus coquereli TaxID=379532 RepID=A0A2K6F554_PROCO